MKNKIVPIILIIIAIILIGAGVFHSISESNNTTEKKLVVPDFVSKNWKEITESNNPIKFSLSADGLISYSNTDVTKYQNCKWNEYDEDKKILKVQCENENSKTEQIEFVIEDYTENTLKVKFNEAEIIEFSLDGQLDESANDLQDTKWKTTIDNNQVQAILFISSTQYYICEGTDPYLSVVQKGTYKYETGDSKIYMCDADGKDCQEYKIIEKNTQQLKLEVSGEEKVYLLSTE